MKKRFLILPLLFLMLAAPMRAWAADSEDFAIAEQTVFYDMSRSWLQGYTPSTDWDTLTLVVPVQSQTAVGKIQGELIMADEATSPLKPQKMTARTQSMGDGLWAVRFSLILHSDRQNGDYPCVIRVTGSDGEGNPLTTDIPYILPIRDGRPNGETARLALTDIQSDLKIGEGGELTGLLINPCKSMVCDNITLRISDESGEILPAGSDTLPVPPLAPGESAEVSFPVTVLNSAAAAPHSVLFELRWTALGEEVIQSEHITVPVAQEIRLEQGGLRMADSVVAGDSVTATLPLMNMGRAEVVNAMVTVSLPGITDRQSVLVGTIPPGETKNAQVTVTAPKDTLGEHTGTITVEAADTDGNPASFDLPINLTVEASALVESLSGESLASQKRPASVYVLSAACVVLAGLLAAQGILLRNKIHRLEEDKL